MENAGVWPRSYATTRQGHEIAFGVNVLAHFVLCRELAAAAVLDATRVVVLTGDIYILGSACTPDFPWHGAIGGYWHNVHGRMQLAADDPALDSVAAAKLWETCEALGSV